VQYRRVGVRWYGNGAFIRDHEIGINILRKQQFIVRKGDLVYNKLFAWKGSFAIADETVDRCIVSDKFPTYIIDESEIYPGFLSNYLKTSIIRDLARSKSKGAAAISKLTLNPPDFLDLSIPSPVIHEQKRIATKMNAIFSRTSQARYLDQRSINFLSMLRISIYDRAFSRFSRDHRALSSVLSEPLINGLSIPSSAKGSGIAFGKAGIANTGVFNPNEVKLVSIDLPEDSPYWLRLGDIVVCRGNSLDFVGRAAMYEGHPERCAITDLLIRVRPESSVLDPRFLSAYFHTTDARTYITANVAGTNPSMRKINQGKLNVMPVPVPPLSEQRRALAYLASNESHLRLLRGAKHGIRAELDALDSAVLERAFRGEI
jgi:type I restriction enzyme S subunit